MTQDIFATQQSRALVMDGDCSERCVLFNGTYDIPVTFEGHDINNGDRLSADRGSIDVTDKGHKGAIHPYLRT